MEKEQLSEYIDINKKNIRSLHYLVYKYYIIIEKNTDFSNIDFDTLMSADNKYGTNGVGDSKILMCKRSLDGNYKRFNSALKDIFEILGISLYLDEWKDDGKYAFWDNEIRFFCELLNDYFENDVWKKYLKKVDNKNFDGFVQLYRKNPTDDFYYVFALAVLYIRHMYLLRHIHEDVTMFENTLYVSTQFYQITYMHNIQKIIFSLPRLTMQDVEMTIGGKLLGDYQHFMQDLEKELSLLVNNRKDCWDKLKKERQQEMSSAIDSAGEGLNAAALEFREILKNESKEASEAVEAIFAGNDDGLESANTKENRDSTRRVREQVMDAINKLSPESQQALNDFLCK